MDTNQIYQINQIKKFPYKNNLYQLQYNKIKQLLQQPFPNSLPNIPSMFQKILQKTGSDNAAYICWVVASILWNLGFIFPSEHKISVQATNLSRGLGLCILNCMGLYWREIFMIQNSGFSTHKVLDKKQLFYVSVRHVLLGLYGYGFAESQFYLPSPVLYTIYFSGPLFVMLLQYFYYGIVLTSKQVKGVVLTGIGVLLTANGPMIWAWLTDDPTYYTTFKNYKTDSPIIKSLVAIGMIILTFGWACAVLLVRQVKGCSHFALNFNLGYILTICSAILYMIFPDLIINMNPLLFFECIVKQGLILATAQAFFMVALLLTKKSGPVCMIGFVSVVFSYFLSVLRYNQDLNILCIVGSLIALLGIYCVVIK